MGTREFRRLAEPAMDGIVTRLDCVSFGIAVNKNAERFYDEGEDFWPKRYAIWGRIVAGQPDQIAFSIIDSKSIDLFMPSVFPPVTADSDKEVCDEPIRGKVMLFHFGDIFCFYSLFVGCMGC